VGVVILAKTVTSEMDGGLPGEELMVCMTLPSREADSNFQFPATVSFVKRRYSSFFCREGADVARSVPPKSGTTSSNPVPSSRQSVSREISPSCIEKSAVAAGCAAPARRHGRRRRAALVNITLTAGNISVGPYSSTAVPTRRFATVVCTGAPSEGSG